MTRTASGAVAAITAAADKTVDHMQGVAEGEADHLTPAQMADLLLGKQPPATPHEDAAAAAAAEGEKKEEEGATTTTTTTDTEGTAAAGEVKPGTPDKALQQLQQDLGVQTRRIAELEAKLAEGGTLSEKEKKDVVTARRKIDAIREAAAKGKDFDILDVEGDVAGSLLEHDDRITRIERELEAERAENKRLRAEGAKRSDAQTWEAVRKAYDGVAVDEVWAKAGKDAAEILGIAEDTQLTERERGMLLSAASKIFHDRCAAAKKGLEARRAAEAEEKKKRDVAAAAKGAPPVTKGGGRATSGEAGPTPGSGGAAVSSDPNDVEAYRRNALSLVREEA